MNRLSTLSEISQYYTQNSDSYLIIDTIVLLLLVIGDYDKDYIELCELMTSQGYKKEHFDVIQEILKRFRHKIVITPHVLSEINMHSKKIKPPRFRKYFETLKKQLGNIRENHVNLEILLRNVGLITFGFTDLSLVELARKENHVILTDDWKLYGTYHEKVPIIKFTVVATNELFDV